MQSDTRKAVEVLLNAITDLDAAFDTWNHASEDAKREATMNMARALGRVLGQRTIVSIDLEYEDKVTV